MLYTRAGPEIGVASTKTFLAQLTANYLVGLALAQARGTKYTDEVAREYHDLEAMADHLIEIPAVSTLFQLLLSTVPMQVFAAGWRGPAATMWTGRATWPSR